MLKLVRFLREFKKQVLLGPAFKILEAIFELIVPTIMAKIIDVGVKNRDVSYILQMGGVLFALAVIGLSTTFICQKYAAEASQGVGTRLRDAMFAKIMDFSHAETDRFSRESLITRVTADVNQIQLAVAMLIRLVIRAPFLVIGSIIMAVIIDASLSLVFLVMAPLVALSTYLVMSRSIPHFKTLQAKLDSIALTAGENLMGARVVRAFSKQRAEAKTAALKSEDYAKTAVRVERISALLNPLTYLILNAAIIAVIWFGGYNVNTGRLTQGEIVAFVNYLSQILVAMLVVANLVVIFTRASASAARINEVLGTPAGMTDAGNAPVSIDESAPAVEFQNIDFAYGGGKNSLEGISFSSRGYQTIGVIGGTGAGKTSLINLIPRFYDATKGSVRVFGKDVRSYPLSQLRRLISVVPQNAGLLSGTIRGNLLMRDAAASEADIEEALAISQSRDFVNSLPKGADTPLLERGKNLSGGQRQRLAIARSLVGHPKILILDDASSALDYATDAKLRSALAEKTGLSLTITISQRANSVKDSDLILVLNEGRLAGMGTHETLLKDCEVYYEICKSQSVAGVA